MVGGEEAIEISNADNLDDSDREEESVRTEVEEKIGCKYPIFMYQPQKFTLRTCTIQKESQNAFIEYTYQDQTLILYIAKSDDEFIDSLRHQGEISDKFEVNNDQMTIEVTKRLDKGDEEPAYVAHWIYDNSYYDISGKIGKEEFIKILKNIRF